MSTHTQVQPQQPQQQPVTDDFKQHVHNWISYENEAKTLHHKLTGVRAARAEEEGHIVHALRSRGMDRAALQTRVGSVVMSSHNSSANLSFSMLEELLPGYFASLGQRNQTSDVIAYIKKNRKTEKEYSLEFKSAPIALSKISN